MPDLIPADKSGLPAAVPLTQRRGLDEERCIALYGAMLSLAASDGSLETDGAELLYRLFDLSVLSDQGRQQVHAFLGSPPNVRELLAPLRTMDEKARCGSMLQLLELAAAEDIITARKRALLRDAQAALDLSDAQVYALESFVATLRTLRHRGADQKAAAKAIRRAIVRLRSAGIPVELSRSTSLLNRHAIGFTCAVLSAALCFGIGVGWTQTLGLSALIYVITAAVWGHICSLPKARAPTKQDLSVFPANIQESIALLQERVADMRSQAVTPPDQTPASFRRNLDAPAGPYLSYVDIRKTLQDADVLMFRGTRPISRMLQAGARSSYSHCGLVAWWHRRAMLLQAESACIQAVPLSIALQSYPGEVDWYQIRPEYRQRVNVSSIIEEAQVNLGLAYGKTALLRTILHDVVGLRLPDDCEHPEALFCSQYVARCFRRAGLPLQPQSDIATFPSEIALSPILRFIGTIVPNMSEAEARAILDRSRAP